MVETTAASDVSVSSFIKNTLDSDVENLGLVVKAVHVVTELPLSLHFKSDPSFIPDCTQSLLCSILI